GLEHPDAVDVPLHDVSAEPVAQSERPLEVDARPRTEGPERRPAERLRRELDREAPPAAARDREAGPVDRDALAELQPRQRPCGREGDAAAPALRLDPLDPGGRLDDAREHRGAPGSGAGAGEEPDEPGIALALRDPIELAAVEPDPAILRAGIDGDALRLADFERRAASGTVGLVRLGGRRPSLSEP